jgi:hypothetical protein
MQRVRSLSRLFVSVLVSALIGLTSASPVLADDDVPRPPGAIDGRGWELVNPPDKNRNAVVASGVSSADGNRVLFGLFGGAADTTGGSRPKLLATRTASGWITKSPMPPRTQMLGDSYTIVSYTSDLTSWIASAQDSLGSTDISPDVSLARLDEDGHQVLLHRFPIFFGVSGVETVSSADLQHVFAVVPEQIDASHMPGAGNVYDFGSGTPVLVSRMPGSGVAPTCGVQEQVEFANNIPGETSQNWVSQDGARAFFLSRGDDLPDCDDPSQLYVRDTQGTPAAGDDATTEISGSPQPGDPDRGVEQFLQATPDGGQVFYRTATSLAGADDLDGDPTDLDIYSWTAQMGNACVTCLAQGANVLTGFTVAAISQDGSHVYFTSAAQLTGDAPATTDDAPNLYVVRGDAIYYVATTDSGGVSDQPRFGGGLTPDGDVLVFWSGNPALDAVSGSVNNGLPQYYRYDDRDGSVICLSCAAGGSTRAAPPSIAASNQSVPAYIRVMSDDGSMIFFPCNEALVPQDVNGGRDIYEWHDGELGLISGGVKQYTPFAQPTIYTTTASGRDVFFRDNAVLTPEVQDSAFQLYDARVGGGFPAPPAPTPPCVGQQCRGDIPAPPTLADPASALLGDDAALPPAVAFTVRHVGVAQRRRLAAGGRIVLSVHVAGAGTLTALAQTRLHGRLVVVARSSGTAHGRGTVALHLRLGATARARLARAGTLRIAVVVRFSQSPAGKRFVVVLKARDGR